MKTLNPEDYPELFLTSCAGKGQYPSESAVLAGIKFYELDGDVDAYPCSFGDHWHYGRSSW